jgi:hypothetical protein
MIAAPLDHAHEFVCCECGQTVVSFIRASEFKLCCSCLMMPGWHTDARLRAIIAPYLPPIEDSPS